MVVPEVKIEKVDYHAETDPVDDVADRTTQDQHKRAATNNIVGILSHKKVSYRRKRPARGDAEEDMPNPVREVSEEAERHTPIKSKGKVKKPIEYRLNLARFKSPESHELRRLVERYNEEKEQRKKNRRACARAPRGIG